MKRDRFEKIAMKKYNNDVIYSIYDLFNNIEPTVELNDNYISFKFKHNVEVNILLDAETEDKSYLQKYVIDKVKRGIKTINIFEYEIRNNRTFNIIKDIINRSINPSINRIVYARNTEVKCIYNSELKEFTNKYHLQGHAQSTINIGIYEKDELLGILTFGRPRFNSNQEYELIRLAYKLNTVVVGGSEKMFKFFINQFKPESIMTYCDITKFTGSVYPKLGFKASEHDITAPNYMWVNGESVLPRYKTQKHKLLAQGLGNPSQTENDIMHSLGYKKVYNAGNLRLVWEK